MRIKYALLFLATCFFTLAEAQIDTTWVQTLTFDSTGRSYYFTFPEGDHNQYQKIIMQYRMRCKDALISTGAERNKGCGEWDYSCNTYITDTTRTDSVLATYKDYKISGFSGTNFEYSSTPIYDLISFEKKEVSYGNTISETSYLINLGAESIADFNQTEKVKKVQYLYTTNELQASGLSAGELQSLVLNCLSTDGNELSGFKVRMQNTTETVLDSAEPILDGFTEVFYDDVSPQTGNNSFKFYTPFNWDGTSSILVELSFVANNSNTIWEGKATTETLGLKASDYGYHIFDGGGYLSLDNVDFSSISDEITFSFWTKGDGDYLGTTNSSIFEGVDANNLRHANVHLPWSNKRVYWDCGNDGTGYDRIDKNILLSDYAGEWHHWAFVKNVNEGRLYIYKDGNTWSTGSSKTKMIDLMKMSLGRSYVGSNYYWGNVDEFTVWAKALTKDEVKSIMAGEESVYTTYSNNIVARLQSTETQVLDLSPQQTIIPAVGTVSHRNYQAKNVFKGFTSTAGRPNITFVKGEYDIVITTKTDYDTLYRAPNVVEYYEVLDGVVTLMDTQYLYEASNTITTDEDGNEIASTPNNVDGTITIETIPYYQKKPTKYEILSFVTPYGIGLDFGENGEMWEFDVTDYGPILKGSKKLSLERGGQNQEQMDIRFGFIKGTPVRNVIDLVQIWPPDVASYQKIQAEEAFEERTVDIPTGTDAYKVRSVITGHGQEGEFIGRNHRITVNGDINVRNVWTECADNPIFPQGGTWIFDRAGWCPGAPSDLTEYEYKNANTGPTQVTLDYGVQSATGDSRYIVNNQLVIYGAPNFSIDARVIDIKRPTNASQYKRWNPSCGNPLVTLENTGSSTITSVTFKYWVDGGTNQEFTWNGSLNFLEKTEVELPITIDFWKENASHFYVEILTVNGSTDENDDNNLRVSQYEPFPVFSGEIALDLRTNARPQENSFAVTTWEGDEILSKNANDFTASKNYNYELSLENGCYMLDFNDEMVGQYGQNGLEFWYYSEFGAGSLRLSDRGTTAPVTTFEPDFGSLIHHSFAVNRALSVEDLKGNHAINIYPNPSNGNFTVNYIEPNAESINVTVYNIYGSEIFNKTYTNTAQGILENITINNPSMGTYLMKIQTENNITSKKLIVE